MSLSMDHYSWQQHAAGKVVRLSRRSLLTRVILFRLLLVSIIVAVNGAAVAETARQFSKGSGSWYAPRTCCPDTYCPKPIPCIDCITPWRTCDDYCRKPIPCLESLAPCRCTDTYCPKPCPKLSPAPWAPFYRCPVPSDTSRGHK